MLDALATMLALVELMDINIHPSWELKWPLFIQLESNYEIFIQVTKV
jgi:hypothetical protein